MKRNNTEVQDITPNGIWLFVKGREYMLPFDDYPWFKGSKIEDVLNVQLLHSDHLYWPKLDVDLGLVALEKPANFPLLSREPEKRTYRAK